MNRHSTDLLTLRLNQLNYSYIPIFQYCSFVCIYRDCYDCCCDSYEEGVEPGEDVPILEEDGGEVVKDDSGAENDEGAAEYGQEGVQRHDAVGASVGLLRLSGKN